MSCCGGNRMGKNPSGFTSVTAQGLSGSLGQSLISTVDKIRDIYTSFGLRPYRVWIVKTKWSLGARGHGIEEVSFTRMLDPTPLVEDLNTLAEVVTPVGLNEMGSVRVSQISGRFTEDMLRGFDDLGTPPGPDENLFYEIEFPVTGAARRFEMDSAPMYYSDKFEWTVTLQKSNQDRARDGGLR